MVPWDFNASLGQDWYTARLSATGDPRDILKDGRLVVTNNLWRRLSKDPKLGGELTTRYAAALKAGLKVEGLLAAFDAYAAETKDAALRDERRWRAPRSYFGRHDATYATEVAYVRKWIVDRWKYLTGLYP